MIRVQTRTPQYTFELFWTLRQFIENGKIEHLIDITNNIFLLITISCGILFLLPVKKKGRVIWIGLLLPILIEVAQLITRLGVFQIDDIFNNILGVVLVYEFYRVVQYIKRDLYRREILKKVAIVTIYDIKPNYGNKLQNYASKYLLENMGFEVETLVSEPQPKEWKIKLKVAVNALTGCKLRGVEAQLEWKKALQFNLFNKQYLNPNMDYITGHLKKTDYNYYCVGSDQVWNPEWYSSYKKKKELFLLTFAESEQMVCMAPSFSVDAIPNEWEEWFKIKLKRFPALTVREETGVQIIEKLTGKKAEVLIDPTMMLDASVWSNIAKIPPNVNIDKPYILTYFLGNYNKRIERDIIKISKKYNLEVYNLNNISQPEIFILGPQEFISLIQHAKIIITDSFHACVFSFLFEKPFLVYSRQGNGSNMMSRIFTLLSKFSLERKYIDSGINNELFEADYSEGFSKLELEREKVHRYLKEVMR